MSESSPYLSIPPATADFAIVGDGIVGAATAFYAARGGCARCSSSGGTRWRFPFVGPNVLGGRASARATASSARSRWRAVWADRAHLDYRIVAGQYTMMPDHRPPIGPTALDGLWINTGYSGHGVMAGPAGGALLIDLLTGRLAPADNPFRPDRAFEERELTVL